ncbi:MAG: histidine--tRNA ligase, partial [Candidatus Micrarchaeota archaeon]|nr:histidine--tRNA ligase [Candidatus Micrarchaeota archaeon]
EQLGRERVLEVLRDTFKLYGYSPVETSILEHYQTAASKFGGGSEILKETYRLTDRGNRELALRYELTFKLAKLFAMHQDIKLPFKRYEVGRVFRDGPVKAGRLREFTQCDVDVIGTESIAADAELLGLTSHIFGKLGIDITIQVNNRKILFGIFEICGIGPDKHHEAAISIDKFEKIGEDAVRSELISKGLANGQVDDLFQIFRKVMALPENNSMVGFLRSVGSRNRESLLISGLNELDRLLEYCAEFNAISEVEFTPNLARGLGYYTGPMWEVYAKESSITSSVAAGGRWDDMTGKFLGTGVKYPATGMGFGLDVIHTVLQEKLIRDGTKSMSSSVPVLLIVPVDNAVANAAMRLATQLREEGVSTDITFNMRVRKALDYANKRDIPLVTVIGDTELENQSAEIKNMRSGHAETVSLEGMSAMIKEIIRSE